MSPLLIENDLLSVRVIPEAGGNILSLCGRPVGRDWLWHNPHLPVTVPVYGASYVETMDSGGWDEIFPSVLPDVVSILASSPPPRLSIDWGMLAIKVRSGDWNPEKWQRGRFSLS